MDPLPRRSYFSAVIFIVFACSLSLLICQIGGHPTYVPQSKKMCKTMTPHHHRDAQASACPYKVLSTANKVRPGESIRVSLLDNDRGDLYGKHKHDKKGFKGFYVQARDTRTDKPIGAFTPTEDQSVKVHNCDHGENNAAFHGVKGHKMNVTIEWTAPPDFQGKVIFTTTFVKKYHKFWTEVKSDPVYVRPSTRNQAATYMFDMF